MVLGCLGLVKIAPNLRIIEISQGEADVRAIFSERPFMFWRLTLGFWAGQPRGAQVIQAIAHH